MLIVQGGLTPGRGRRSASWLPETSRDSPGSTGRPKTLDTRRIQITGRKAVRVKIDTDVMHWVISGLEGADM